MPQETAAPAGSDRAPALALSSPATSTSTAGTGVRSPGEARFDFDFEDADLPELVRLVGRITGKRFIYSGKMPVIQASLHSPQRVTADEAYRAFLTILETNGLTVVERGPFHNIVPSPGVPVPNGTTR